MLIQLEGESDQQYQARLDRMRKAENGPMDPVYAAQLAVHAIANPFLFNKPQRHPDQDGSEHMAWMFLEIAKGEMSISKANRWLGWAQCLAMIYKHLTPEQCKEINRRAGA